MGVAELGALRNAATVVEIGRQHLELKIDQRLKKTCLDMGALACLAAANERGEHALNDGASRE